MLRGGTQKLSTDTPAPSPLDHWRFCGNSSSASSPQLPALSMKSVLPWQCPWAPRGVTVPGRVALWKVPAQALSVPCGWIGWMLPLQSLGESSRESLNPAWAAMNASILCKQQTARSSSEALEEPGVLCCPPSWEQSPEPRDTAREGLQH